MPYIFGELLSAQLENRTSDYAGTVTGAVWLRTDTGRVSLSSGSIVKQFLVNDDKIIIGTNGTAANNVRVHRSANSVLQFVLGNDATAEGSASTSIAQTSVRPENYSTAGRPAAGAAGRIVYDTNLGYHVYDNGSVWSSFGSGSSSAGAAGIEVLMQKVEHEKSGLFTEPLDNTAFISGKTTFIDGVVGRLLKDTSSGVTSLELVWNPVFLNDSDRDFNSTSNFTAVGAGTSLTTNGTTKQIGSASLQFDKTTGNTEAGIRYDRGSQNFALGTFTEAFFYINLPSITQLSDVYIKVYADSTSNYRKYVKTADVSGTALATGWNLIKVDLANDSGTNTGSGWATTQLSRYVEIGVDTSASGQTYTTILVDSVCFSMSNPNKLGLLGQEITLYDTSNKESVVLDASNTRYSGRLTTAAATSNSYTGGIEQASAMGAERCTTSSGGFITTFNSNFTSGAVSTTSEVRFGRKLRASLAGDLSAIIDVTTSQIAKINTVGGSTVGIDDPSDLSANYANGDSVDIFRPKYIDGDTGYDYVSTLSLTAASTYSSGTTTLTLNPSGLLVGDIVVKRHLTTYVSCVAESANEAFGAASFSTSPDGIQILDNFLNYTNREYLIGHFSLGGPQAATNIAPTPALIMSEDNTVNKNAAFLYGRLGSTGFANGVNQYKFNTPQYTYFDGGTRLQFSCWFYGVAFDGNHRALFSQFITPNQGIIIARDASSNTFYLYVDSQSTTNMPFNVGAWNHYFVHILDGNSYAYLNGTKSNVLTSSVSLLANNVFIGNAHSGAGSGLTNSDALADMLFWYNGPEFTADQVKQIYNNGNYRPFNVGSVRYKYANTGQTGQKISAKVQLSRTTSAVSPVITKAGLLIS